MIRVRADGLSESRFRLLHQIGRQLIVGRHLLSSGQQNCAEVVEGARVVGPQPVAKQFSSNSALHPSGTWGTNMTKRKTLNFAWAEDLRWD